MSFPCEKPRTDTDTDFLCENGEVTGANVFACHGFNLRGIDGMGEC